MLELDAGRGPVLVESMIICDYLDDAHGGAPLEPAARANARLFAHLFSSALSYVPILRAEAGSDEEAAAIVALREGMAAIDGYLVAHGEAGGPFLLGAWSVAETATAPFAQRFVSVLPGLRPRLDPRAMMRDDGLTRLAAWVDAVVARPSAVATVPPESELVEGYSKLLERMKAAT